MSLKLDLKIDDPKSELNSTYKELIDGASEILINTLNSQDLEEEIVNYKWFHRRKGWIHKFNHTNITNRRIWESIMSGDDMFVDENPTDSNSLGDQDVDIWLTPYRGAPNVIGKTNRRTYQSWINLNFWDPKVIRERANLEFIKLELAENLIHEYCHNLGFDHKGSKKHRHNNIHSVPYAVGSIVHRIAREKMEALNFDDRHLLAQESDFDEPFEVDCTFCKGRSEFA